MKNLTPVNFGIFKNLVTSFNNNCVLKWKNKSLIKYLFNWSLVIKVFFFPFTIHLFCVNFKNVLLKPRDKV
ncbi:MAG: hypothetical protein AUG81_12620 [Verrucomicrobia bacterium 13_1_20CM_4_54_11]|nr:MAG: hypothetical protein AUG81_12620 [Verrucomicrobia bacterium 13_1_20CM_4_54_11]